MDRCRVVVELENETNIISCLNMSHISVTGLGKIILLSNNKIVYNSFRFYWQILLLYSTFLVDDDKYILHMRFTPTISTHDCEVITRDGDIRTFECYKQLPFVCKINAQDVHFDDRCMVHGTGKLTVTMSILLQTFLHMS